MRVLVHDIGNVLVYFFLSIKLHEFAWIRLASLSISQISNRVYPCFSLSAAVKKVKKKPSSSSSQQPRGKKGPFSRVEVLSSLQFPYFFKLIFLSHCCTMAMAAYLHYLCCSKNVPPHKKEPLARAFIHFLILPFFLFSFFSLEERWSWKCWSCSCSFCKGGKGFAAFSHTLASVGVKSISMLQILMSCLFLRSLNKSMFLSPFYIHPHKPTVA